ncbi:MAG: Fic family protein [Treponema sp.]|nr:Fic family protein [Treponema sp.]
MSKEKSSSFEIDFDSYIIQSEPDKQENGKLWQTAIGLQQVDGLTPSKYLYETAKRNIDGEISIEEAKQLIDSYYETRQGRTEDEDDAEEADKVSVRIREILAEKTFSFTPDLLLSIHQRLFTGVFYKVKAGRFRDYNISKREWGLDVLAPKAQMSIISTHANGGRSPTYGESVLYANADMIRQTLEYDFGQEKAFDYSTLSKEEAVKHLTRFIANIWQIHPLLENNRYTYDELAARINKTRETVRTNLRALEKMDLITRNGADKNGFWNVHIDATN